MAKKEKTSVQQMIQELKNNISALAQSTKYIPDIIEFCESPNYLGLSGDERNPIALYPLQKIALKTFYRGSKGNENLTLTEEEIEICKKFGLDTISRGDILSKIDNGEIFKELVLVWGRRSGKDFIVSIIASYEAMRLLECESGDPYKTYGISPDNPINILTVATSSNQAKISFQEIKGKLLRSPYFRDKYTSDGITANQFFLLTPADKENNKEMQSKGLPTTRGSIIVEVGHSNSSSLLGKQCFVLILDEVASYKTTGGTSSGDIIYQALTPSVNTFFRRIPIFDDTGKPVLDEDGEQLHDIEFDGKILTISSPRGSEGILHSLYENAHNVPQRLMMRLPTWAVNPYQTREALRSNNESMSELQFMMEFGAEFAGTAGEQFFNPDDLSNCFNNEYSEKEYGEPGKIYFAHLDPATTSHNYALIVLHKEWYLNKEKKQSDFQIVVDHIHYWHPTPDSPIKIAEVDEYVINMKKKFKFAMVTYDQWNSAESIAKLIKAGIPNKVTRFTRMHKIAIYDQLEQLVIAGKIKIPYNMLLKAEMTELQRRYDSTGYKVYPKSDGDGACSDDIVDCLAAACYQSMRSDLNNLPRLRTVDTGMDSQANNVVWRNMQGGIYGKKDLQLINRIKGDR